MSKTRTGKDFYGVPIEDIIEPHFLNRRKPPLSETHSHLSYEWHFSKNCGWGPEDFSAGSGVSVWWKCSNNKKHFWRATILHRSSGEGCPYCANQKVHPTNCLATCYPDLASELHAKKNKVTAWEVTAKTKSLLWWQCRNNKRHVWQATASQRVYFGSGCRQCARNQLSLTDQFPWALKYFDHTLNPGLKPDKLSHHKKVNWRCKAGPDHVWCKPFNNRLKDNKSFCPFCNFRMLSVTNSLSSAYPDIAEEFHPTKNGKLTAKDVLGRSGAKYWWRCKQNKRHIWQATVSNRTRGSGCPDCWKKRQPAFLAEFNAKKRKAKS